MARIVIIPSIAGSMLDNKQITVTITPITPEQLKEISNGAEIINYIRHPATNQLLQQLIPNMRQAPSPEYKILASDVIIMVSLAQRAPVSGQEVQVQSLNQLVLYRVSVLSS